ncbi:MAG: hypothetical protein U0232_23390 [Thermomicrobiales bacterium]
MVGGLLGHGQQTQQAAQPSVAPFASDTHVVTMWDFREDRRAETRDRFIVDQFTYREDRAWRPATCSRRTSSPIGRIAAWRAPAPPSPPTPSSTARTGGWAPASSSRPIEKATYREDRRVENIAPAWAPDFWTYREDRRDH